MMNNMDNMDKKKVTKLRSVKLKVVAEYLKCDPKLLAIALRRLAETPSVIEYGRNSAAAIGQAKLVYNLMYTDEVAELEALFKKADKRKQTKAAYHHRLLIMTRRGRKHVRQELGPCKNRGHRPE